MISGLQMISEVNQCKLFMCCICDLNIRNPAGIGFASIGVIGTVVKLRLSTFR